MYLYVYKSFGGGKDRQERTEELIRRCVRQYGEEEALDLNPEAPIIRAERGKPYFSSGVPEFSVSHTGSLWVCLMGDQPVGVDVQKIRRCSMEAIARRYYTPDEQEYAADTGEEGFFQIWTRKEAYAKFTGQGLTGEMCFFSTLKDSLEDSLEDSGPVFSDFFIMEGVRGACCMKEKRELWIREIR